jgi:hypothetical protein
MAEELAYESWVGSETFIDGQFVGSTWDLVQLGEVFLPGVCTIDDFEVGRDIDVQKKRKKEKARLRDNGLSPVAFNIIVEMNASHWAEWLRIRPQILPKEGGVRTPMTITHPLVNAHGVKDIYIHKVKIEPPTARGGMKVTLRVAEWFEEEKDAQPKKDVKNAPPPVHPLVFASGAGHKISNLGGPTEPGDDPADRVLD